jgi:thiosulfate dehydrogenase [quinone] large subunit
MNQLKSRGGRVLQDPPFAKWLTNNLMAAWLWLPLRLWLGYRWVEAARHKVTNPAWVSGGEALKGYWTAAVQIPEGGRPPITFDWYRSFIMTLLETEAYTWFGKLVAYGELLVGIALILGAFTGITAFFGAFMNFNFMLAGTASSNPLLFLIAIGLILAWKVAGYIGADYFLLRWIGVPWQWELPKGDEARTVEPSRA